MFTSVKFLLTDAKISRVEKIMTKLILSLSMIYVIINMTKLLKNAVV